MKTQTIGGLSDRYERLTNAIVAPLDADNRCGVLRQDGEFCEFSRGFMGPRRATDTPVKPEGTILNLPGRHLFGGWIRPHFGHFLLEATARLWAFDELADHIESVVFIPFRRGGARKARNQYQPFLDIVTDGSPLNVISKAVQVDELIVPDPGFGHGTRITGSPRYRAHFRSRVKSAVSPNGPERLYISRTQLLDKRGAVFGEARIEALMANDGYTVFHPQNHSLVEQLAHYRAAREIVCLDGSALHMAAYAIEPGTRIGIVLRRHAGLIDGLVRQLNVFADADVQCFDALRNSWVDESTQRVDFRSIGELDLPKLQTMLRDAGFVGHHPIVKDMTAWDIKKTISEMDRGPMRPVPIERNLQ